MATLKRTIKTDEKDNPTPRFDIDLQKVEDMAKVCDSEEDIAESIGISYRTLQNYKKYYASFASAIKRGKAKKHVFTGGKLHEAVARGEPWAICFELKTRFGYRETSKHELTGANGNPIELNQTTNCPDLSKVPKDELRKAYEILFGRIGGNGSK